MTGLAQPGDGLEPTEDLLDAFALLLADRISAMTSSALIDNTGLLARNMGSYLVVTQLLDKLLAVIAFVANAAA